MPSPGAEMSQLHQLHQQLKEVQDQLSRGPRQINARQNRIGQMQQALEAQDQELKNCRAIVDRKNLDLRSKETHMADLQTKLNTAASNREYEIIRGQIEADQAAKAVLEDEVLEALDRVDLSQRAIAESKQQVQTAEEELRAFADAFEAKASGLRDQEQQLQGRITEAEKAIPSDFQEQYRRLVAAYGAESMASAQNGMCNFCFVNLTPQSRVVLHSGKVMFCSSCGRLLYDSAE